MPNRDEQLLTLRSGRQLCFAEYGDPEGAPLLYFHGWPSSRLQASLLHDIACEAKLRLIAPDRPGAGKSDPQPDRHLRDWPPVMEELIDHLGLDRVLVMGVSGGGPYAIACASWLPERVRAASVVCGAPPLHEFPDRSALLFPYRMLLRLRPVAPLLLIPLLPFSRWVATQQAHQVPLKWILAWIDPADRAALEHHDDLRVIMAGFREGSIQGGLPLMQDADIYLEDWDIDYAKLTTPIDIWHGALDRNLPITMAQEIASRIPKARTHWIADQGHYSLAMNKAPEIIDALVELADQAH